MYISMLYLGGQGVIAMTFIILVSSSFRVSSLNLDGRDEIRPASDSRSLRKLQPVLSDPTSPGGRIFVWISGCAL